MIAEQLVLHMTVGEKYMIIELEEQRQNFILDS